MKQFGGKILFLDKDDINTDEIIPAKYLTENSREALKPYCLEDLKLEGFNPKTESAGKAVIITRKNFGCGSSREHAPWTLEVNGINIVIAESFARIFRQNMYNCGMIAAELPSETIDSLFVEFSGQNAILSVDIEKNVLTIKAGEKEKTIPFVLKDFEAALVQAGGWVEYAAKHY
ncbi:MAG: 3-isopropylmalate dehydratase small subunit [Treponema sp.]|nr:3-isopropylmalate dehydratase small subunit [Treponema sp.]